MKWIFIVANILAAIGIEFLGGMAVAAHRTHAYSTYHEFQERHVLVERADYDVEQRMRGIAAGGAYYLWLSHIGAGACLINAIVIGVLCKRAPINSVQPTAARSAASGG